MPRLEIRLSDGEAARLDELRGSTPKGTWIKERLGLVELGDGVESRPVTSATGKVPEPARRPPTERRLPKRVQRDLGEGTPLPKIAPRKTGWL